MSELDVAAQQRFAEVTARRRQVMAGALDALALARTNAARAEHAIQVASAAASPGPEGAEAATDPAGAGWERRPDAGEIRVGVPEDDDPAPVRPAPRRSAVDDDDLEGQDWLQRVTPTDGTVRPRGPSDR